MTNICTKFRYFLCNSNTISSHFVNFDSNLQNGKHESGGDAKFELIQNGVYGGTYGKTIEKKFDANFGLEELH